MDGDVEIVVRVTSLDSEVPPLTAEVPPSIARGGVQAGVMIRETADSASPMGAGYFSVVEPRSYCDPGPYPTAVISGGWTTARHLFNGVPIIADGFPYASRWTRSIWLRLQRIGDDFAVERSRDGHTWVPMGGGRFTGRRQLIGFYVAGVSDQAGRSSRPRVSTTSPSDRRSSISARAGSAPPSPRSLPATSASARAASTSRPTAPPISPRPPSTTGTASTP